MAESEKDIQKPLDAASSFCQEWKLDVKTTKTKIAISFLKAIGKQITQAS